MCNRACLFALVAGRARVGVSGARCSHHYMLVDMLGEEDFQNEPGDHQYMSVDLPGIGELLERALTILLKSRSAVKFRGLQDFYHKGAYYGVMKNLFYMTT